MKLYNTLTRAAETFSPSGDTVKMYVCGLTPYGAPHLGHAMRAVVFDVLRRYLEFRGYEVKHVENFTDIDDKMIDGAAAAGISTQELAGQNIDVYLAEMDSLNVLRAHVYPKATEEIPAIRQIIEVLIQKEIAYAIDGDVYFRVRLDKEYGKLSRRSLNDMRAGARVEIDESKEDLMDFALWKSQKPGEPAWDSPWGRGRPGWHIECSAMSMHYLDTTVDIHGGGQDLLFPHHENEIAQSESYADGKPMARFWVHNGLLHLGDDKMSKSLGNIATVSEALTRFSSDALRLFFLSSHYRSPLTYRDESVAAQERAAERLRNAAILPGGPSEGRALQTEPFRERFVAAMDDDLNTPRALAVLFDLAHEINRAREDDGHVADAQDTLRELASVLGLTLAEPARQEDVNLEQLVHLLAAVHSELRSEKLGHMADHLAQQLEGHGIQMTTLTRDREKPETEAPAIVDALLETREQLRGARRYDLADNIRNGLGDAGYALEDTPHGTEWKRVSSSRRS